MDFLQQTLTLVRIADTGSISRAAASLGISVPMASRHLGQLERALGVELARRTTRRLDLTAAGRELVIRGRSILSAVDEARDAVRPGVGGTLVVSLPVAVGLELVTPQIQDLLARHRRLRLELRFEDQLVDLLVEGVDVALRVGTPPTEGASMAVRRLAGFRRVLCAAPALQRRARIRRIEQLARVPCLLQGRGAAWRLEENARSFELGVDGALRATSVLALRDAAIAGLGVALLPEWVIAEALAAGRLVRVLPAIRSPPVELYALYHVGSRGRPALRVVLDHLAAELPRRMTAAP